MAMKLSEYIGSQFGNPRGIFGKLCCVVMNVINKAQYKGVLQSIQLESPSHILDIGYGNGYLIHKLYKQNRCSIYGIDISEDMKKKALKKNHIGVAANQISLEVGDCCSLQYEDCFFDAVTSVNTIYFWNDTLKGLSEIHRILKMGGIFSNAIYSKAWMEKLSYTKKGFILFEPKEIAMLAKKAGFKKVVIKKIKHGNCFIINCIK